MVVSLVEEEGHKAAFLYFPNVQPEAAVITNEA
jgi:hypothetical protein